MKLLSPGIRKEDGSTSSIRKVSQKECSTLKPFTASQMISLTAGTLGERGTQLSMETFHSGSSALNMNSVSSYIFKCAFEATDYIDFLTSIQNYDSGRVDILGKINPYSVYFEILYNFAGFIKSNLKIKSFKKFISDTKLRGFLTCLTFESSDAIMKKVMEEQQDGKGMIFNETHPRVNYSFFRRDGE